MGGICNVIQTSWPQYPLAPKKRPVSHWKNWRTEPVWTPHISERSNVAAGIRIYRPSPASRRALGISPRALFNCGTLDEPDYARLIAFACSTLITNFSAYTILSFRGILGSFLMERITVAEIDSIAELYLAEVTYEAVPETIPSPDGAYCGYGIAAVHQGKRHKVRLSLMPGCHDEPAAGRNDCPYPDRKPGPL